jgi:hypothetical protein
MQWQVTAVPWALQGATNLNGPWSNLTNINLAICNAWYHLAIPIEPFTNRFFRLASPTQ